MPQRSTVLVVATLALAIGLGVSLGLRLFGGDRTLFLAGTTSDGHHQLEASCELCHVPFDGIAEQTCRDCHAEALEADGDSHPAKLFDDPGRSEQLARVDARSCLTCHGEHLADDWPDGVTIAPDFKLGDVMGAVVIRIKQ